MNKIETGKFLKECSLLAAKMADLGSNTKLTYDEQCEINKFIQENLIETLYDLEIYRLADLTFEDIVNLNFLVAMEFIANIHSKSVNDHIFYAQNLLIGIYVNYSLK